MNRRNRPPPLAKLAISMTEWHRGDDSVWYDILAFSRPSHPLAMFGYPLVRRLQKRFAEDSMRAMITAVRPGD